MDTSQETLSAPAAMPVADRLPPHSTQDDPLLDCLVEITRMHGTPYTAQALSNGLPLENNRLTPSLLERAAARAKFSSRILRRALQGIPSGLLPAIVLLHDSRADILLEEREDGSFLLQFPEVSSTVEMTAAELQAVYTGYLCFVRPQFRFEKRASQGVVGKQGHWFWSAVLDNKRLYREHCWRRCSSTCLRWRFPCSA